MNTATMYPLAFLAGLVSFVSPCVLPLLPGYLSFVSGSSVENLQSGRNLDTRRILLSTVLFVAGFSIIFTLLGSALGIVGGTLKEYKYFIQYVAGIVIIVMALFMMGALKPSVLNREFRLMSGKNRLGLFGALPLGMAFAIGWTPCIGPILASIYMLALNSPEKGASLLFVYSLGLGVPFVLSGVLFSRMIGTFDWFKRRSGLIHKVSGITLLVIGILLLTGQWAPLVAPLQSYFQLPI